MEPLHVDAAPQGCLQLERPIGGGHRRPLDERVVVELVEEPLAGVAVEARPTVLQGAEGLLERFRERAPDGHCLPHRLHLCTEHGGRPGELLERPAGTLVTT